MAAPAPRRGPRENPPDAQAEVEELLQIGERIRQDLSAIEEQRAMLAEVVGDYQRGREALEALRAASGEIEVLVPLGGGNFVPAKLTGGAKVVASIGSGVHLDSSIEDALARLATRLASAESSTQRLAEEARRLSNEMNKINMHLSALAEAPRA